MADTSDRLISKFEREGTARLDRLALEMAVTVAAEIVGLTESEPRSMARRLEAFFDAGLGKSSGLLGSLMFFLRGQAHMGLFYWKDVRPAIRARRGTAKADVISHLLSEGYPGQAILTECVVYGAAGMVTTREFITVAAWHLLEDNALRRRFLASPEIERIEVLEEILRLEPVVGTLYRRRDGDEISDPVAIDVRSANADEAAVGRCPYRLNPGRSRAVRVGAAGLAFGDGEHRCPGAGVAMYESMIFLDRLLQVPGLRMETTPKILWNDLISGYELRDVIIHCNAK
jgi:cytochrome P450